MYSQPPRPSLNISLQGMPLVQPKQDSNSENSSSTCTKLVLLQHHPACHHKLQLSNLGQNPTIIHNQISSQHS